MTLRLPFAGSDQSSFSFVSADYVISILKHLVDKNYFRREIQSGETPVEGELKFVDVVEYFMPQYIMDNEYFEKLKGEGKSQCRLT